MSDYRSYPNGILKLERLVKQAYLDLNERNPGSAPSSIRYEVKPTLYL